MVVLGFMYRDKIFPVGGTTNTMVVCHCQLPKLGLVSTKNKVVQNITTKLSIPIYKATISSLQSNLTILVL